jgi:hypothetical protein
MTPISLCLYVYAAREGLSENVTAVTNTHAKIELLDTSFSMQSVSYQRKAGDQFFVEVLVYYYYYYYYCCHHYHSYH